MLSKVKAVLPENLSQRLESLPIFALGFHMSKSMRANLEPVRIAVSGRKLLRFEYNRADGKPSSRVVRPLGLYY